MSTYPVSCFFVVVLFYKGKVVVKIYTNEEMASLLTRLANEAGTICDWLDGGNLDGGFDKHKRVTMTRFLNDWSTVKIRQEFLLLLVNDVFVPSQGRTDFYRPYKIAGKAFVAMMFCVFRGECSPQSNQVNAAKKFFAAVRKEAFEVSAKLLAVEEAVMEVA